MRTNIAVLFLLLTACEPHRERSKCEVFEVQTEQERYLKSTPDAPLDFYCKVNDALNSNTRVAVCNLVSSKSTILSADMLIEIKDHKIDTVEIVTFSFDQGGNRRIEDLDSGLNTVVNSISAPDLLTFRQLKNGTYIMRLQLERFCIGYVTNISLEDETARKLIEESTSAE